MIPIEPVADAATTVANLDSIRQLSFVIVLMGLAAVVCAIAFLVNEWRRGTINKAEREQNQKMFVEMMNSVRQSAQAQAETAVAIDDINQLKAVVQESTKTSAENVRVVSDVVAAMTLLNESNKSMTAANTNVQHSLIDLRAEIVAMATSNKARIEAIEKMLAELNITYGKGVEFVGSVETSMKGILNALDRMDTQLAQLIVKLDTAQKGTGEVTS